MHKYIIAGPQGAGKGTQARLLCQDYDLEHLSIGDILRWNMGHHTKLAARVRRIMEQGLLVPDEIVEGIVRRRLAEHDWNYGFVLDGFPRTREQAVFLFESYNIDAAIYLDVPGKIVYQRVMHRAKVGDGTSSNLRTDDTPETLRVRLREYHEKTAPLLELFEAKGMLVRVDGVGSIEEIYQAIRDALGLPEPKTDDNGA